MDKESKPKQSVAPQSISWEFEEKANTTFSTNWYIGMVVGFIILMALAILVIKSWSFALLLVVLAAALVVYIKRPSRTIQYVLDKDSIFIDDSEYKLGDFKAFGVTQNNAVFSLILIPTKRFAPSVNLDFPEKIGESVVDFFGARLPMQEIKPNFVDDIINRLGL